MKYYASLLLLILSVFTLTTSQAEELSIDKLKMQQQQLQSLLSEIEQATQRRTQHNVQITRLKDQLECNWTLIRAYEVCGQLHANNPKEHLNCSSKAKHNTRKCLSTDEPK